MKHTKTELKRLKKLAKMWRKPTLSELTKEHLEYGKKLAERNKNEAS